MSRSVPGTDEDIAPVRADAAPTVSAMTIDRREALAIFVGGAIGAVGRAALADAIAAGDGWPWATFVVNVVGAGLLGYVVTGPPVRRALLGSGFCGALTTFSTLQIELLDLLDRGRVGVALAYVAASVAAGLLVVAIGGRRTA